MRIILTAISLLILAACQSDDRHITQHVTPGGVDYVLILMPGSEDITVQIAWNTDWFFREDRNPAVPVIGVQLLLAGGTKDYAPGVAGERFADIDTEANLRTNAEHLLGTLTFRKEHLDETIAIVNAHLQAPALPQTVIDRIATAVANNMKEINAKPLTKGFDTVRWAVWGDQPLRRFLSMTEESFFEEITRSDVFAWHKASITRRPVALAVAGDLTPDEASAMVDAALRGLPESPEAMITHDAPDFSPRRILFHDDEAEASHLMLVATLPPTREGYEFEDIIILNALGNSEQSILFEAVREKLRASYQFSAFQDAYTKDHRLFTMAGSVETAKLAEVEAAVVEAYQAFRANGPEGDLARRKAPIAAALKENRDYVDVMAWSALQAQLDDVDPKHILLLASELEAISEESILARLGEAYPDPDNFIIVAVSPDATALPGACIITRAQDAQNC